MIPGRENGRAARSRPSPARRDEQGAVLLLAALLMVVLISLAGLAIDGARIASARQHLQVVADAGALAGAHALDGDDSDDFLDTRRVVADLAASYDVDGRPVTLDLNAGNDPTGDIVLGRWDAETRTLDTEAPAPDAVAVNVRRTGAAGGPLTLFFGGLFGVDASDAARGAIAQGRNGDATVIVLDPAMSGAVRMVGNARITLDAGHLQIDSNAGCALEMTGNAKVTADAVDVAGGSCTSGNAVDGTVNEGAPVLGDPLAGVLPDAGAWNAVRASLPQPSGAHGKIGGSGTWQPGHYPQGIRLSGNRSAELLPGVYMLGGNGIRMSGNTRLTGEGVTLLVDQGATVDLSGNAELELSPDTSGPYAGITLFLHRATTASQACDLSGNGDLDLAGTLYVPSGEMRLTGNGAGSQFGSLVVDRLRITGNGHHRVTAEMMAGGERRVSLVR